jgi:acid phosphatase (class A)
MGVVLASLMPDKAQAILTRASQFAENRLVCGVHFRSDIVAGQTLGTVIAVDLMQNADFRKEYDAAAAELSAAHLRTGN